MGIQSPRTFWSAGDRLERLRDKLSELSSVETTAPASQRLWVRFPLKTPEILHMRKLLKLSSKCKDHFFSSSLNRTSEIFLSLRNSG